MEAFSSSERSPTSSHSSSKLLNANRKPPAVKKPFPPRHASGAFSSTRMRAPCSRAASAAHIPALPPPTTITSYAVAISGLLHVVVDIHALSHVDGVSRTLRGG